jgi:hypothetical protein
MIMLSMTLEQLRTAREAGGITDVILKGLGGEFYVHIATRNGSSAVLATARSTKPRRFGNPAAALNVLREVGITIGQFDASEWNPTEREPTPGTSGRAEALRKAHKAAAYSDWLAAEIQAAIDDPRPSLTHDDIMAEMDTDINAMVSGQKPARRKRA